MIAAQSFWYGDINQFSVTIQQNFDHSISCTWKQSVSLQVGAVQFPGHLPYPIVTAPQVNGSQQA